MGRKGRYEEKEEEEWIENGMREKDEGNASD